MPVWGNRVAKGLGLIILGALIFSWFGVYGSGRDPFIARFISWFSTIGTGAAASMIVVPWVEDGPPARLHTGLKVALISALISFPITAVLLGFITYTGRVPGLGDFVTQYVYVLAVSAVLTTLGWLVRPDDEPGQDEDPIASFLERLPVKYRTAELYALSAEDHYLRAHTSLGEELILMRLSDALRELDGAAGLQTHRSWWVAHAGVKDARREDGKLVLILRSGGEAAVSRRYAAAVKAAGLS